MRIAMVTLLSIAVGSILGSVLVSATRKLYRTFWKPWRTKCATLEISSFAGKDTKATTAKSSSGLPIKSAATTVSTARASSFYRFQYVRGWTGKLGQFEVEGPLRKTTEEAWDDAIKAGLPPDSGIIRRSVQ